MLVPYVARALVAHENFTHYALRVGSVGFHRRRNKRIPGQRVDKIMKINVSRYHRGQQ